MTALPPQLSAPRRCPVCAKPAVADDAPFCSRGCRDRDLIAWLSDDYRLPAAGAGDGLDSGEERD